MHAQDISSQSIGPHASGASAEDDLQAHCMSKLCMITVPGLRVSSDWRTVHDRLLDEFPEVTDVLATTTKETILVVHDPAAPENACLWLDTVSETILYGKQRRSTPRRVTESHGGRCTRDRRRSSADAHRVGPLTS